ncbi:MAG TPA: hypothetical protein VLK26_10890 [Rudaea sp.]|nr:hypothetical protein [Rudaea sp.]
MILAIRDDRKNATTTNIRFRRNQQRSINGAATSQNGSQPNSASCARSGGKTRHARVPAASHTQRTFSSALARLAGFDKVNMI